MNRNNMPLILMLTAGAITWIIAAVNRYTVTAQLVVVFIVLLIFYFLGSALKWTLDYFDKHNDQKNKESGEVIEKETGEETESAGSESKP